MVVKLGTKDNLIGMLAGEFVYLPKAYWHRSVSGLHLNDNEIAFVWNDKENECDETLPDMIVVNDNNIVSFLAWSHTFFPGFRPMTSYIHVATLSEFDAFSSRELHKLDSSFDTVVAGAIISEAITRATNLNDPSSLKLIPCFSTLSYAFAQGILLGATSSELDLLSMSWTEARKISGSTQQSIHSNNLLDIWNILLELFTGDYYRVSSKSNTRILSALNEIKVYGHLSFDLWSSLVNHDSEYYDLFYNLSDSSREEKMSSFRKAMQLDKSLTQDPLTKSFIIAYLASSVAPGSFSHYKLISQYSDPLNLSIIWYGIITGVNPSNDVLSAFNALGRRLIRDLHAKSIFTRSPVCDISLSEIRMLMNSSKNDLGIRALSSSSTVVEIFPYVTTHLAWPRQVSSADVYSSCPASHALQYKELGVLLHHARQIYDGLQPIFTKNTTPNENNILYRSYINEPSKKTNRKKSKS